MTMDELKALPVGTLLSMKQDDGSTEVGEITETGLLQVVTIWPETGRTVYVGLTPTWASFISWLEVAE